MRVQGSVPRGGKHKGLVRMKGKTIVVSVDRPAPKKKGTPTLSKLLEDEEIANFFRFVKQFNLRAKALKLINQRIADC